MMRFKISRAIGTAMLAVFLALPLVGSPYHTSLGLTLMIAFILAQSWDWVGGEAGYVNLGHFVFYGLGAYVFCILLTRGVPLAACFLAASCVTATVAAVLAFPLFRLHGDYFAFATLALLPLFELLAFNLSPLTGGADGIVLPPNYVLRPAFYLATALAVATLWLTGALSASRFGYSLKSIRNDELAAEVVGIRIFPAKLAVLTLSALFAGLAGAIQAWQLSYIDPPTVFGLNVALVPVAMALLGGSGKRWGPLIGVLILFALQQWLLVNITVLQGTVYGLAILLIGRFMPGGLLRARFLMNAWFLRPLAEERSASDTAPAANVTSLSTLALPIPAVSGRRGDVLLETRDLTMRFGGNIAVNNVNITIRQGEIVGLVGANGSGKTTLFNCISKVYGPTGSIVFDGLELKSLRRDEVSRAGVGRTFQNPRPFGDLTVAENIAIALTFRADNVPLSEAFAEASQFAAFVGLTDRLSTRADALTLQERKSLELARALALKPKLLLVDEVASGLTPSEVRQFVAHIRAIRDTYGISVIWVEHIFSALVQVVDRLIVLEQGVVIADAPLADAVRDPRVLKSYLGSDPAHVA
jgi:branched-chain amino acid transport system permease protein